MPAFIPPAEYVLAARMLPHVTTSRATTSEPALLRRPVAWVLWPVLTLTRTEDGVQVVAVLVDHPDVPRYRVFYCTAEEALAVLQRSPRAARWLAARKQYLDYRTAEHLMDDGWRVD